VAGCAQATEDVQQGLTQDDFDMYYETWEKFDEAATQYIPLSALSEFVDTLEEPLRLPAPNLYKLVSLNIPTRTDGQTDGRTPDRCFTASLNIPICDGDRVHCVDILDALRSRVQAAASYSCSVGDFDAPTTSY